MEIGKEKRILRLEQQQQATDQKESLCSCSCHYKTFGGFHEVTEKQVSEFVETALRENPNFFEEPRGRKAYSPKCTCNCKH